MTTQQEDAKIVREFKHLGMFLAMEGEMFRSRTYIRTSEMLSMFENIREEHRKGNVRAIKGVGKSIIQKLDQLLNEGSIRLLEGLRIKYPVDLEELTQIEGVGPMTIKKAFEEYRVRNVADLKEACERGYIANLPRVGEKNQAKILESILSK